MSKVVLVYEQIVVDILGQIKNNKIKSGDKLLSESSCVEKHDVSRGTVRKAYGYLEEKGYVFRKHGSGRFVVENVLDILAKNEEPLFKKANKKNIALIISSDISFNGPIIEGVKTNISKNGWSFEIMQSDTPEQERKCIKNLIERNDIDGTIIMPVRVKDEWRLDFYSAVSKKKNSFVVIGKPPHGMMAASISVDDSITVYSIVEDFYKKGCKRVVMLHESVEGELVFNNRLRSYYIAMSRYYYNTKETVFDINSNNWLIEAEMFLNQTTETVGFILFNGNTIIPLFNLIEKTKKQLKKNVFVTAYGTEQEYDFFDKKLSVMKIPKFEIAQKAVEMLYEQIVFGKTDYIKNIIFPAQYLDGDT